MAILSGFIGIDRYQDTRISDLNGARRDASALWALLSDSIPELNGILLVDDQATSHGVETLFAKTLDMATDDDVVILSFAGHGTRDHRLVMADSSLDDLPATQFQCQT